MHAAEVQAKEWVGKVPERGWKSEIRESRVDHRDGEESKENVPAEVAQANVRVVRPDDVIAVTIPELAVLLQNRLAFVLGRPALGALRMLGIRRDVGSRGVCG